VIASTFFTIEVVGVEMRRCVMVEKKRLQGFGVFVAPLGKVSQSYPFSKVVKQHTVQCYARRCPTPISYRGAARGYLQEPSVNSNAIIRAALSGKRPRALRAWSSAGESMHV
jgi:hypothetical protein